MMASLPRVQNLSNIPMFGLKNACEFRVLTHIISMCFSVTFSPMSFSKIVPLGTGMTTDTTGLHQLQRPHWSSLALIHLTPNPALLGIQGRRSKCCPEPSRGHGAKDTDQPIWQDVCPSPSASVGRQTSELLVQAPKATEGLHAPLQRGTSPPWN